MNIRLKLMLTMLAIAFFITILLSLVAISAVDESTKQTLTSTATPLSEQAAKNLNSSMKQYTLSFVQAAQSTEFIEETASGNRLRTLRESFTAGNDCSASLFTTDGSLIAADNDKIAELIDAQSISESAVSAVPIVTDLFALEDNIYFTILVAAKAGNDRVVAALTINADVLTKAILDDAFGDNGVGYLVDDQGTVILHSEKKYALDGFNAITEAENNKEFKEVSKAIQNAINGDNGSEEYKYDGKDYVIGYCQTEYFGSTFITVISVDDFSSYAQKIILMVIIVGGILLLVTAIISLIFARSISKPLTSATKRIRLLAQGNLSAPVDVWYSKDELGVMTTSLEETIVCLRQYINLITVALTQILEGNLTFRMEGTFKGDFEQIKTTFNEIFDGLTDTFASINTAAEQVNSGAFQVSNSSQEVSQGSTQQASAIEELSATLKDVAKQCEQNAQDAKNAYNIVASNTEAIGSCNDDMEQMLSSINDIHTASAEISKIIKVIDEIAFQTNILALNAAVEAAREGSKGFGVVADEVRRLASRSADAAKQTAALIENSSEAVSKGSDIAKKTASSLHVVVRGSEEIKGLVKNISEASDLQTEAITQINTGLDQISTVVAANTTSSVATASASEELSSQSLILKNMIARFKLKSDKKSTSSEDAAMDYSYPTPVYDDYGSPDEEKDDELDLSEYGLVPDDDMKDLFSDDDKY